MGLQPNLDQQITVKLNVQAVRINGKNTRK